MKIFLDSNIPFAQEMFSDLGELHSFEGRNVTAEQLKDADALLVRSITQVNEALLCKNERLQFVGTATIGMDHIDKTYLSARNIPFHSAPGCNKESVAQYVVSAILVHAEKHLINLQGKTVGIVGAGNTGSAVWQKLTALGMKCHLCDPLLEQAGDKRQFVDMKTIMECDFISLHVPLTVDGDYATKHLFDQQRLRQLNQHQVLINTSRGDVINNQALLERVESGSLPTLILDVWENEPNIEMALLPYTDIATPHIAGYSLEGKANGTEILYRALCQQLGETPSKKVSQFLPPAVVDSIQINAELNQNLVKSLVHLVYDVRRDDNIFRAEIGLPNGFDLMRKNYRERREFSTLNVSLGANQEAHLLAALGFTIAN
ncbi:4-phosphoerythronate dehydrogenase [Motilimonas sp. 1_MG-2023]|uniref:4-phosphoerythronate dehydrogenase n=1 Tax=Motilimonas sp. 1_MG-2023 TaxID=3062672 RepID=UPI0026E28935|nr:4-phosphoerythronate dehydrogenase [Motilimonas sp. 1_MG-2023]MDO6526796.1 4-phosphoerythronate dehydrogenase [Motilimonas sp. 1_MG-2023]